MTDAETLGRLNSLITATDAACLAGVAAATIRTWVDRGLLPIADTDDQGRNLFRLVDVARAERATRERARRPSPAPVPAQRSA